MNSKTKKKDRLTQLGVLGVLLLAVLFFAGCNPYNCSNLPEELRNLEASTQYMFVLWRPAVQPVDAFRATLFDDISPQLLARSPQRLTVMVAAPEIKSITLIKRPREDGSTVAALISATVASQEEAEAFADIIEPYAAFVAGYEVSRTVPLDYEKTWPDGERSPGVQQVTFLRQRQDLDYEDFRNYWFCSHTPYALDIHPLWKYERNEVVEAITENAPDYNGIVELYLHEIEDLTNLNRFFGGNFIVNALRIDFDVNNFIDMNTIEVTAMTEYILKSGDEE